jgi:hypothetical protein
MVADDNRDLNDAMRDMSSSMASRWSALTGRGLRPLFQEKPDSCSWISHAEDDGWMSWKRS